MALPAKIVLPMAFGLSCAIVWTLFRILMNSVTVGGELPSSMTLESFQLGKDAVISIVEQQFLMSLAVWSSIYLVKQAFAIPGSVLLNIIGGAFFPLPIVVPLTCILTACGASSCFLLSRTVGSEETIFNLCEKLLPGKLGTLKRKILSCREEGTLFYYLIFLRAFPLSPNWFLNMAAPWVGVPLLPHFASSVAIGLLPYNFVTVRAGVMLSELKSTSDIMSWSVLLQLLCIASVMLLPSFYVKQNKKLKHDSAAAYGKGGHIA